MQPTATPQALSAAPSSTLCPLIADVALSFALHSVPQVEQRLQKWITVDPGSLHKTNRVRTP